MIQSMRRSNRAITAKAAHAILEKGEYGILSTVDINGQPYGVPLNYCVLNNQIYFHCALDGHKLTNLEFNARASFCVVGNTRILPEKFAAIYESTIVFGVVREATGNEKQAVLEALLRKYSPTFYGKGLAYIQSAGEQTRVFGISIDSISGKARN